MLELYHLPKSICSQKVRLALAEKGMEWKGHIVDLSRFENLKPDYLALNPSGVIPTLVHDGVAIAESSVICEYLDDIQPEPPLSPADAIGRAHMRVWLRFIDEIPSMAVRVPSFNDVLLAGYRKMQPNEFEVLLRRMTVRRSFFRRMGQTGFSAEEYADAIRQLEMTVERMQGAFDQHGGPWLMGAQLTVADLCLAPVIQRMADLGLDRLLRSGSAILPWLEQLRERPSWRQAFADDAYLQRARV